ncbi:MAG TPA: PadR family transcriptional regulator [Polyangiaceae bacterium]|nr:PadR family transcriptional regulator [Polyangiaceae bacterium]
MRSRPAPTSDPNGFLPLPASAMYILTSLGEGPSHGYRIMTTVEELSGGSVRLGPGTLYGSLKRMVGQGLIEEVEERPDPELDDERRRYYRLTALGTRVAGAELDRLTTLAAAARRRLPPVLPAPPALGFVP